MRKIIILFLLIGISTANAQKVQIVANPDSGLGVGLNYIAYKNENYFVYVNAQGKGQLAKYANNIITLIPTPTNINIYNNTSFIIFKNELFFYCYDSINSNNYQVASYNGSSMHKIIYPSTKYSAITNSFTIYNNKLYYPLQNDSTGLINAIAEYSNNTVSVINLPVNYAITYTSFVVNNKLCFWGSVVNNFSIITYNGSSFNFSDTSQNLNINNISRVFPDIQYMNNEAYIEVAHQQTPSQPFSREIIKFNGNQVSFVYTDSSGGVHWRDWGEKSVVYNSKLYYTNYSPYNQYSGLLQYDGSQNTKISLPANFYNISFFLSADVLNNKLFFAARDTTNYKPPFYSKKTDLATYNGNTISIIKNINFDYDILTFAKTKDKLFIGYRTLSNQYVLGSYDDTVFRIYPVPDSLGVLYPDLTLVMGNMIYFKYRNRFGKYQLAFMNDSIPETPCYPAINIVSNANNICYGTKVTFTATASDTGTAPIYQWKKNNINVGGNSSIYVDSTLNPYDTIKCAVTNTSCFTGILSAVSNEYIVKSMILDPYAYIPNTSDNTVSVVDLSINAVIKTLAMPTANVATVAVSPNNATVYVAGDNSHSTFVIDVATNTIYTTIPYPTKITRSMCFSKDGSKLFIADSNEIRVINTSTNTLITTITGVNGIFITNLKISNDGSKLYVLSIYYTLTVYNANTFAYISSTVIGMLPVGLVENTTGNKLYITSHAYPNFPPSVDVFNTTTNTIDTSISLGTLPYSYAIAINPTGDRLYATCDSSKKMFVINTNTNAIIATIYFTYKPYAVNVSADGSKIYVYNGSYLTSIDAATNTIIKNIVVGNGNFVVGNFIANLPSPCNTTTPYSITGTLKNVKGVTIKNASVYVSGSSTAELKTDNIGSYNTMLNTGSYVVKPTKNNDIAKANGVTSIDVLLTQRHILNTAKLNNAYKIIAADVDGNKVVNSIDILRMKRLILGTDTTFKNTATNENRLWAFVDSAYQFPDTTNPFPFKDSISFTNLTSNKTNQTFIGVKLGDVNFDWNSAVAKPSAVNCLQSTANSQPLTENCVQLVVTNKATQSPSFGGVGEAVFSTLNSATLSALQTTIHFDNTQYEFVSIGNNKYNIDFNTTQANKTGNISLVWIDKQGETKTFKAGEELFSLVLSKRSTVSGQQFTDWQLNDDITPTAAFDEALNKKGITLRLQSAVNGNLSAVDGQQWTIYPNPAKDVVHIASFNDIKAIKLINAAGQVVIQQSVNGKYNYQLTINNYQLPKGLYIIQITTTKNEVYNNKLVVE